MKPIKYFFIFSLGFSCNLYPSSIYEFELATVQVVDSLVPLAEMFQYVSTLRGMTKGRASYTMQLAKFEVVPQHIQNQLVSKEEAVAA